MNFQRGTVVRSKAGHDKGSFYAVVSLEGDSAYVADGQKKTTAEPKLKKLVHLAFTKTVLSEQTMNNDSKIQSALEPFNRAVRAD